MIPLEDFFRNPDKVMLRLSPDGSHLAYLEPWEHRLNVVVQDLTSGETVRVTSATERDIAGFLWASDDRLVYVQDTGGDENYHLYGVRRDGSDTKAFTPFEGVKCDLIDDLEEQDDLILFGMNKRNREVFDAYRLEVRTGEMELVGDNPGNITMWRADHEGRLRVAGTTDGANTSILFREDESGPWRTVATYDFRETVLPLLFTFDNEALYAASNVDRDKAAIIEYDLSSGTERTLIYEHPEVDVYHLMHSRKRKCITGVSFETDRTRFHFFDAERERIQRLLDERLSGRVNHITSRSRDETKFVVFSSSDRSRGRYYLLDADTDELTHLFDVAPWLDEDELAPMQPIELESRDGLTLHGYLTLPLGVKPERLPMVVNPHGGPWARDVWGYNGEVQFLANRGYAVLQVNFRTSTGYGRKFWEAGFGQWGLAMQDDITDAVEWAIDHGIADPDRVAIYGASYGGYATLAGVTKTPELYACGISNVGVSNLFTMLERIPPYWKPFLEMEYQMVGHPERDEARLRATSPYFNADRIRAPMLIVHGANDPRVNQIESDQIVEALRKRGIEVEYMLKGNEGHGFRNEENRLEFYEALERFLGRHLPN